MIKKADHVGFSVKNIEESLFFWTHVLGGEVLREGKMSGPIIDEVTCARGADVRMALLELAGMKIELLQYNNIEQPEVPSAPYIPGYAHLAFMVENLDTLLSKISDYGWKTPGIPQTVSSGPMKGTRVIYVQSPDGQTLELMEGRQ